MKKPKYTIDLYDCKLVFLCNKCNYGTFEQWRMLGHLASEHLPKSKPRKAKLCPSCGLTMMQCTANNACPKSNPAKLERGVAKKLKDCLDNEGFRL